MATVLGRLRRSLVAAATLAAVVLPAAATPAPAAAADTYRNPLSIASPVGAVENCGDPTATRAQLPSGAWRWFLYCTKDPRNDDDRTPGGDLAFQEIPIYSSSDLVHWRYRGNVFGDGNFPSWVVRGGGLFAPEIVAWKGRYWLYYTATNTDEATSGEPGCDSDSAIGVAVADSPAGPFIDAGGPVVGPRRNGPGCNFFWTYDPEVAVADGKRWMFFGSYYGGIHARRLIDGGRSTDAGTETAIAIPNRYEAPEILRKDGWFYLLGSATNCCNGPLTGYSVFAARSRSITGPYLDRDGVSLLDGRVGGTPFLTLNGDRWVGSGHQTTVRDFAGRDWAIYHAVDRADPWFRGAVGFTKRPPLLDPIAWVNGWPAVRAGRWASDQPMPVPAAQPGMVDRYDPQTPWRSQPGAPIAALSDEFDGGAPGPQWSWVRKDDAATVSGGMLRWPTQDADLYVGSNNASVLLEDAPSGDYVVEARVRVDVPAEGCCFNYVQGGLVIYGGDDRFLKLATVSIWETRQTEWAKEIPRAPQGAPRYGNTVVGSPGEWTTLRIVKVNDPDGGPDWYQAWTKRQGDAWVRGGTWRQSFPDERIGLVSMGGSGFTTQVDWVRVSRLDPRGPTPVIER